MSEEKSLVQNEKSVIERLRENSGESTEQAPFIPILQVDNTKEKKMIEDREVDVLCRPRWKMSRKGEDGEYVNTVIESFGGAILKIMYQVVNNGKWDDKSGKMVPNDSPYFTSNLFSPGCLFGKKFINIRMSETKEVLSLTYPDLKDKFGGDFQLIGWVFVLLNGELVRLKMTGSSRSVLFDFPKLFKQNDSVSAHPIVFSAEYVSTPQPHNVAKLEIAPEGSPFDLSMVLEMQEVLNKLFNISVSKVTEAVGGEVVEAQNAEEEITIDNVVF